MGANFVWERDSRFEIFALFLGSSNEVTMKKQSSLFDFLSKAPAKRKAEDNEDANDSPKKAKKIEKKVFDVEEIEDVCV